MKKASVELLEVGFIKSAIRGMRNPTKSHYKSDSGEVSGKFYIGDNDLRLARKLVLRGNDHGKFARVIQASFDITFPRDLWQELDTYRVGVECASSESTIYTLNKDGFSEDNFVEGTPLQAIDAFRSVYLSTDDRRIRKHALPEGWLQKRTKIFSYQALRSIYFARRSHPMQEWEIFTKAIEDLPYAKDLITCEMFDQEWINKVERESKKYGIRVEFK
jgi:hypothetical protein